MLITYYQTTRCHNLEDNNINLPMETSYLVHIFPLWGCCPFENSTEISTPPLMLLEQGS
jgi:hypothetical protein